MHFLNLSGSVIDDPRIVQSIPNELSDLFSAYFVENGTVSLAEMQTAMRQANIQGFIVDPATILTGLNTAATELNNAFGRDVLLSYRDGSIYVPVAN